MFKKNKILDIYQINKYLVAIFMYKYYHNDLPEVFRDMYITDDTIHTYSTRQEHLYHIPLCRTESFKKTIRYREAIIWNELPSAIRSNSSIYQFNKSFKAQFFDQSTS